MSSNRASLTNAALLMAVALAAQPPQAQQTYTIKAAPPRRRGAPDPMREPAQLSDPPAPREFDAERIAAAEAKRARKNARRARQFHPEQAA